MASVRKLKKEINEFTFELVNECVVYHQFHPEAGLEKIDVAIKSIIEKRNDLVDRINNPIKSDNAKAIKAHYKAIINDANGMVALMDNLI